MAFFTAAQLFGNGSGSPGGAGWVPVDTSAPPTFSGNNRGIAFGEQLTSAIANRPHYALALNDDDLNTRLAEFEVGGLDAAYDLGTIADPGGGRVITKDGGAVETVSALSVQYNDDVANAHFRADSRADVLIGGGGFEHVGDTALYGLMDRRTFDFANNTVLTGNVAATLNFGGAAVDGITIGAGVFKTGTDTDLILGYDMIEVLSGGFRGLYVITALPTTTRATVRRLDGTTPSFTSGLATTIRVFRPTFGSFSRLGHSGTLLGMDGVSASGLPGQTSALVLVPGAAYGRYGTVYADGSPYALTVKHRSAEGALTDAATIDGLGQFRSYANALDLTDAQREASADFGNAGFFSRQDENDGNAEVGFLSRSTGGSLYQFAFVASNDCRTPANPSGTFAFDFINVGDNNVEFGDVNLADWFMAAGISFVEITSPSAQAGIYLVYYREANTGQAELRSISGDVLTSFPTSGAGTMRAIQTSIIGARSIDVGSSAWANTTGTTAAVFESPAGLADSAITLVASMQNDQALIRGVGIQDGGNSEVFRVSGTGAVRSLASVYATTGFEITSINGDFSFTTPRTKTITVPVHHAQPETPSAVAAWDAQGNAWTSKTATYYLFVPLPLPIGAVVTAVRAVVAPGAARAPASRVSLDVQEQAMNWAAAGAPTSTVHGTADEDNGGTSIQFLDVTGLSVAKTASNTILVRIKAGASGSPPNDGFYGVRVTFLDPGPRND